MLMLYKQKYFHNFFFYKQNDIVVDTTFLKVSNISERTGFFFMLLIINFCKKKIIKKRPLMYFLVTRFNTNSNVVYNSLILDLSNIQKYNCNVLGFNLVEPIGSTFFLNKKLNRFSMLRSPFVNKVSWEHREVVTYSGDHLIYGTQYQNFFYLDYLDFYLNYLLLNSYVYGFFIKRLNVV